MSSMLQVSKFNVIECKFLKFVVVNWGFLFIDIKLQQITKFHLVM